MARRRLVIGLSLIGIALASVNLPADDWSWSSLNPFSKSEKTGNRYVPQKKSNGVTVPRFDMPGKSRGASRKSSEPSAWSKFTDGTKSFFSKTNELLNPFSKPKKKKPSILERFKTSSTNTAKQTGEFLTGWMVSEEETSNQPPTMKEFLSRPRPKY